MKTRYNTVTVEGQSWEYEYRDSWGHRYYSFDGGANWHRTKAEAYRQAKHNADLCPKGQIRSMRTSVDSSTQGGRI